MANWVTHLMIADEALKELDHLLPRGFCVGSIAPDCNIENEDWTGFTPPREITHWMDGEIKDEDDCERFLKAYFLSRRIDSEEEYAFLLGYYAHLIEDAEYMAFLRDPARVKAAWERIEKSLAPGEKIMATQRDWQGIKTVFGKERRMKELSRIEYEYLSDNPDSGYIRHILNLDAFPDYIDYLPENAIKRKIGVMPKPVNKKIELISMTKEELYEFVRKTKDKVVLKIRKAEEMRKGETECSEK